jgi:hypothetical protein
MEMHELFNNANSMYTHDMRAYMCERRLNEIGKKQKEKENQIENGGVEDKDKEGQV